MATNPHTYEIARQASKHFRRIMAEPAGLKDWRRLRYDEDYEEAAQRIALAYAVVDFLLDSPRWERFEREMVALRERNEARRRADAA